MITASCISGDVVLLKCHILLGMCGIDFLISVRVRFLKKTRIRFGMNLVRFGLQNLGSVRIVIYY